jgi:hypothetical protein
LFNYHQNKLSQMVVRNHLLLRFKGNKILHFVVIVMMFVMVVVD